ncbi:MAG: hypothetical protein LBL66_03475 [Clostridiales bacterium]|nr:hypothetical protein [Clostridiales bacterium]
MRGARSATKQSLYKKARIVFGRDCRAALPRYQRRIGYKMTEEYRKC